VLDERGEILGYLKYGEKQVARKRLKQESRMLGNLPEGAGPVLLKFGPFGAGDALVTTTLVGKRVPITLRPDEALTEFLATLDVSCPVPLEVHPWVRFVRAQPGSDVEFPLEALAGRDWPVVLQHGDFAPWNLLRRPDGRFGAIDWEYGSLEGFPYLDLAFHVLQIQALIYRRVPQRAAEYAIKYLTRQPRLALSQGEAGALVRLAAYDAFLKSREDGGPEYAGRTSVVALATSRLAIRRSDPHARPCATESEGADSQIGQLADAP
jgi:hypothetical protein